MGIFSSKTKKEEVAKPKAQKNVVAKKADTKEVVVIKPAVKAATSTLSSGGAFSHVLKSPRVTEKASFLTARSNAYVFDIAPRINEWEVRKAIFELYKVQPVKVAILPVRGKKVFRQGKVGQTASGRKAYVYLKAEDKIEII